LLTATLLISVIEKDFPIGKVIKWPQKRKSSASETTLTRFVK